MLGWLERCKLAHAFLWEYSHKRAKVGPTSGPTACVSHSRIASDRREGAWGRARGRLWTVHCTAVHCTAHRATAPTPPPPEYNHKRAEVGPTSGPTACVSHSRIASDRREGARARARTPVDGALHGGALNLDAPRRHLRAAAAAGPSVTPPSLAAAAPEAHQRSQTALTGYPAADCAGPVQLRARTACCRRALMQTALAQFSYARGLPAAPELPWPALSLLV